MDLWGQDEQLADFSKGQDILSGSVYTLESPGISETNLYDAVIAGLERMRPVTGRKAILLISSGIDTFNKASLDDALKGLQHFRDALCNRPGSCLREAGGV
jgi:Ca-activated chloride channel family protein